MIMAYNWVLRVIWMGVIMAFITAPVTLIIAKRDSSGMSYVLPRPELELEQGGGKVYGWPSRCRGLKEIHMAASILELQFKGLLLPSYSDSAQICYVIEGRAAFGLTDPNGNPTNVRYVRTGDVVLVLPGWPFWLWNTAKPHMKAVCMVDTSGGVDPGSYKPFVLAGRCGRSNETRSGGILHGFSRGIIAHAWDVDKDRVERIVAAKEEDIIIKVKPKSMGRFMSSVGGDDLGEFSYNVQTARPDAIERGGWLTFLNENKLPNLHALNFGASLIKLDPSSLFSPHWLINAGQLVYVLKGRGRVEIGGITPLVRETVREGDLFVVPQLAPHAMIASDENPLELITFYTSADIQMSLLAGSESVYRSIPAEVLAASFNVSMGTLSKLKKQRSEDKYILKFP